jgi:hypothetical protein
MSPPGPPFAPDPPAIPGLPATPESPQTPDAAAALRASTTAATPPAPPAPEAPEALEAKAKALAAIPAPPRAGVASAIGSRLAALLLGVACVVWTATPSLHTGLAKTALAVAIIAVTAGGLRLAFADVPQPEDQFYLPGYQRAWLMFLALLRTLAWEETAAAATLWLEVQHAIRPWHTAALGAALLGYLLATHIAESGADATPVLRRQARILVAGACLLALGAGFAMIPSAAPGAGSAILRVLAAIAVIAAAALVLPG